LGRARFGSLDEANLAQGRQCLEGRFERLLAAFPAATRFLLPLKSTPIDEALAGELGPILEGVAASAGRTVEEEATFSGWGTGPVLRLVRVAKAAAGRASAPSAGGG
jgi:hypothetical protein